MLSAVITWPIDWGGLWDDITQQGGDFFIKLGEFLNERWPLLIVLVAFYIFISVRIARQMTKLGRGGVRWFFITLFFTAIPAGLVLLWHNFGWLIRGERHPDDIRDETKGQDR